MNKFIPVTYVYRDHKSEALERETKKALENTQSEEEDNSEPTDPILRQIQGLPPLEEEGKSFSIELPEEVFDDEDYNYEYHTGMINVNCIDGFHEVSWSTVVEKSNGNYTYIKESVEELMKKIAGTI